MAGEHLPEDIIVKILSNLPVKSLLRFRCVSKRWRSIVSDPQFARLQFKVACEQQTLSRRFILGGPASPLESLDVEATWFQANSTIRKLDFPIRQGSVVEPLCSCNGLVCVALGENESFYIWNPSIGFTHRLPDPCYSTEDNLWHYGFGYVSATDDYKLLLVVFRDLVRVGQMFSLRTRNWKKIEADPLNSSPVSQGVLLNEALHWLNWIHHGFLNPDSDDEKDKRAIIAFDLAREEFWKMPVPFVARDDNYPYPEVGVSCDGCLCLIFSPLESPVSIEIWVMREYGKGDSWTKLYNLKTCNPPKRLLTLVPVLIMQSCAVVIMHSHESGLELVRFNHHEEKLGETSTVAARVRVPGNRCEMTGYEESLFWLSDYLGVEETMVASNRIKTSNGQMGDFPEPLLAPSRPCAPATPQPRWSLSNGVCHVFYFSDNHFLLYNKFLS